VISCAGILIALRKEQEAVAASTWSRPRVAGVALVVIVVAGIATWAIAATACASSGDTISSRAESGG
jgi:hypothetical protein